jgi:arginase
MTSVPFAPDRVAAGTVALLGLPTDEASSYLRGAARGPAAIREALYSSSTNLSTESGLDLEMDPRFLDVGDLDLPHLAGVAGDDEEVEGEDEDRDAEGSEAERGETTRRRIEEAATTLLEQGARVLALGGDHAVTYPLLRAHAQHHEDLTVVQVDAHPDLYHHFEGDRWSHACVFARVLEADLVTRLVQVGVRGMNPVQRRQADRFGVEVLDFSRLETRQRRRSGWVPAIQGPVYLSLDLDALDPSCAPGVSHPEPGGLMTREVLHLIQSLDGPLVGADVVELNPARDVYDLTARTAAKLVKEIAARMLE